MDVLGGGMGSRRCRTGATGRRDRWRLRPVRQRVLFGARNLGPGDGSGGVGAAAAAVRVRAHHGAERRSRRQRCRLRRWPPPMAGRDPRGSGWTSLAPFASQVSSVLVRPNGEILAAGNLLLLGGANLGAFARWSATAWVPLGEGVPGFASSMVLLANGDAVLSAVDPSGPTPAWTSNAIQRIQPDGSGLTSIVPLPAGPSTGAWR